MRKTTLSTFLALAGLTLSLSTASLKAQSAPAAPAAAPAPAATSPASSTEAPPQKGMVWVNTTSGAYHMEGTKYYGKTKKGKYMTEADAIKAGYHAAAKKPAKS